MSVIRKMFWNGCGCHVFICQPKTRRGNPVVADPTYATPPLDKINPFGNYHITSNIRHKVFRSFLCFFHPSIMLRGPPWNMKQGWLETFGQSLISLNSKHKRKLFSLNRPHWADSVIESPCPCVCLFVCLRHRVQFFSRPIIGPDVT